MKNLNLLLKANFTHLQKWLDEVQKTYLIQLGRFSKHLCRSGSYEKAIKAFQKLQLKYPEKRFILQPGIKQIESDKFTIDYIPFCIRFNLFSSHIVNIGHTCSKNPKGGLASNFSSSNQVMGVRQETTDFLEKAT